VRVVFRNFPLDQACNRKVDRMMHAHACEAARAALCAHQQGKFAAAYEALFQHQESITSGSEGVSLKLVQDAGADGSQLNGCVGSPETAAALSRDIEEGINLGISSTPTFFINGHRTMPMPPAAWGKLIDELLKQGSGK
jgi:protein-disulfide isomerase